MNLTSCNGQLLLDPFLPRITPCITFQTNHIRCYALHLRIVRYCQGGFIGLRLSGLVPAILNGQMQFNLAQYGEIVLKKTNVILNFSICSNMVYDSKRTFKVNHNMIGNLVHGGPHPEAVKIQKNELTWITHGEWTTQWASFHPFLKTTVARYIFVFLETVIFILLLFCLKSFKGNQWSWDKPGRAFPRLS